MKIRFRLHTRGDCMEWAWVVRVCACGVSRVGGHPQTILPSRIQTSPKKPTLGGPHHLVHRAFLSSCPKRCILSYSVCFFYEKKKRASALREEIRWYSSPERPHITSTPRDEPTKREWNVVSHEEAQNSIVKWNYMSRRCVHPTLLLCM